jgi:hypothetical protein
VASKISINLDTSKENFLVAKCKQNDDLTLEAYIYENGAELDLTNKEIIIQALKSDNTYIIQNTEIAKENNKILAELDRDFSRVSGTTKIEIVLVESGKQNTTFSFYLEVSASVIKGAVESSNTVTVLEALDNKIIETGQVLVEAIQVKEDTEQLIESGGAATTGDIANITAQLEHIKNQRGITLYQLGCFPLESTTHPNVDSGVIIDAYLRNPLRATNKIIFPSGTWKANINNNQSNMTFEFEDGCVIDGTLHIAVGTGKDVAPNPSTITYVENVTAIGNIRCTDRVGGYYCRNIYIDKITILDTDSKYPNQTAQGGARGVHFYLGAYNIFINDIVIQNTITYGVAFDIGTTQTEDHWTKNVKVGRIIIEKCSAEGLILSVAKDIDIGTLIIKQYCKVLKNNTGGIYINNAKGFIKIGNSKIDGTGSLGTCDGLYINGAEKIFMDNLDIANSNHYGITNTGSGTLNLGIASIKNSAGLGIYNYADLYFQKLEVDTCVGQGMLSPTIPVKGLFFKATHCTVGAKLSYGYIENFEAYNNTSYGLQIETITNCISFNKVRCSDNVGNNIRVLNCSGFKATMLESIDTSVVAGKTGVNLYGVTSSQVGTVYAEKSTTGISLTNCVNLAINSTSTKDNTTGLINAGGNSNITIVTRQSNGDATAESGNIPAITGFKGL